MKKYMIMAYIVLAFSLSANAQDLSLSTCIDSAVANMPALQQSDGIKNSLANKIKSYEALNLPTLNLNGQITYQSAVPELPFSIPNMPGLEIPQTQFRSYLEVSQPIYNGGVSKALKGAETASSIAQIAQLNISALALKKQVTELYFNILEIQSQSEILDETILLLTEKQGVLEAAFENGVAQQNDLLKLKSQLLTLNNQQQLIDKKAASAIDILEILCGFPISENQQLIPTESNFSVSTDLKNNPELMYLSASATALESKVDVIKTQRMPKVVAFGQGGFGQPNPLNIFEADVAGYYMLGAKLQWKITDWGNTARDLQNIEIGTEQLGLMQQQKSIELNSKITQLLADIDVLDLTILNDIQVIELQKQIVKNAKTQYDQGIITFTEYMDEELVLKQAEIGLSTHKTQKEKAEHLLQLEIGNL
ncbi:MAG: TolC family protein [Bacteroidia bacterium]